MRLEAVTFNREICVYALLVTNSLVRCLGQVETKAAQKWS